MSGTKFCVSAMLAGSFTICSASEIVTELNEYIILYLQGKELSLPTDTYCTNTDSDPSPEEKESNRAAHAC